MNMEEIMASRAYTFTGQVLPNTVRINTNNLIVGRAVKGEMDCPDGSMQVRISDNRIVATFQTTDVLADDLAFANLRNLAVDLAWSICDSTSILCGAWTTVHIDTCVGPDGNIVRTFAPFNSDLAAAFHQSRVTVDDIVAINTHEHGYFFRLALIDIRFGLMDAKFLSSHLYRAIEALRTSVSYSILDASAMQDKKEQWACFRSELGLSRDEVDLFARHSERHGEYHVAAPLSGPQVTEMLVAMAHVIKNFVSWFKKTHFAAR